MASLPVNGTDCHTHLFGPADRFPYAPDRAYTPADAQEDEARRMLARLGLGRIVLVHASVYADNDRLFHGLEAFGDRARGVAVLSGRETTAELRRWRARGVAGVRINNVSNNVHSPDAVADAVHATSRRIAEHGWHVQVLLKDADLAAVLERVADLPTPLVVDHFGLLSANAERDRALQELLLANLATGRIWIKLSASYRLPGIGAETAKSLTRLFVATNPERLVWGSDWPHPPADRTPEARLVEQPFRAVETKLLFADFLGSLPSEAVRRQILVDNPAALYCFQ